MSPLSQMRIKASQMEAEIADYQKRVDQLSTDVGHIRATIAILQKEDDQPAQEADQSVEASA